MSSSSSVPSVSLKILRQTTAELLAKVVLDLFPGAFLIGSEVTDLGFHYDFFLNQPLDEQGIPLIEERMRALSKSDLPIRKMEMMRENAVEFFKHKKQPYKGDWIASIRDNIVPVFQMGEFWDAGCLLPYGQNANEVKAFKLLKIYKTTTHLPGNPAFSVTRIQGTAFPDNQKLKEFLKKAEAAKKRDHRILGKELGLFSLHEEACGGFWFWNPKGALLRDVLLNWWRDEHRKQKFLPLVTPGLVKPAFLKKSGYDSSEEKKPLFPSFSHEGVDYAASPSQDGLHALVYQSKLHSYRELPIRYAECAELYYKGKSSHLWGMLRARAYLADRGHIFCMESQVQEELISSLQFIDKTIKMFGFEYHWYLSTRGSKFAGTLAMWEKGIDAMKKALEACHFDYTLDKESKPFDGPQIELRLVDALEREWKGPSLSFNFNLSERFGLLYQGADDQMHVPVMITRTVFGSLERFIAILIEHYAGWFPLWLAPEQVRIIPVGTKNADYATGVCKKIEEIGFRVGVDYRQETLGGKVHAAELERIPYVLIVGEKEEQKGKVTLRSCKQKQRQEILSLEAFLKQLCEEEESKGLFRDKF
jgi:threonyl-tRNA synthetase